MEVLEMEQDKKNESHLTSAAAFVEGGIQEACDDACSICLEEFCKSDPSTVTNCKHEFHLQCILEWCQRSSQCPMCWQSISLKDPTSQELLEVVEHERNIRMTPSRNATVFHHPTLGDFELQHLPVGASDTELEERIIQHLAAAAAMGRNHHFGRREGQRSRSSSHDRPHFLVFSTHPSAQRSGSVPTSTLHVGGDAEPAAIAVASPSIPLTSVQDEQSQQSLHFPSGPADQIASSASGSTVMLSNQQGIYSINRRSSSSRSSPQNEGIAGPSELQSLSESLKSRFNAVSMRYKESISKGTRGWKERLFSRNTSMADIGSDVRREVNAGIASVSRMMERLETRENSRVDDSSVANRSADSSVAEQSNQNAAENLGGNPLNESKNIASYATSSGLS